MSQLGLQQSARTRCGRHFLLEIPLIRPHKSGDRMVQFLTPGTAFPAPRQMRTHQLLVDVEGELSAHVFGSASTTASRRCCLGPGVSRGYAVTNLRAHYDLTKRLQLAVQIDNLFDKHYYTAAQLANTGLTSQGTFLARPFPAYTSGPNAGSYPLQGAAFFAPGAPRRAWVELRLRF